MDRAHTSEGRLPSCISRQPTSSKRERLKASGAVGLAVMALLGGCEYLGFPTMAEERAVTSFEVSPKAATIAVGGLVRLAATPESEAGNLLTVCTITWSSSDAQVASVDGSGVVTGESVGSAAVSAMCHDLIDSAAITVLADEPPPVASIDISPKSANITVGTTVQLTATPLDASGNPLTGRAITWSSSNRQVATVNADGVVTGVSVGTATVSATCDGQTASASITVVNAPPPPPPGADEPVFDPAAHNSLWFDDFSSYASLAEMRQGAGAHPWSANNSWAHWSLNNGGRNGSRYMRHNFQAGGEYGTEMWANDDELQGQDPNVVIMTMWIRNTGTYYTGKVTVFKVGDDDGRWVLGQGSAGPSPHPQITRTYWDADNWPYPALDPSEAQDPYDGLGIEFNRDAVQCGAPQAWWGYKQNRNWGTLPSIEHWNDGEWHRFTISWTKSGGSGACGNGKGRLEYWWDGVKVLEWLGDDPSRPEYGLVFVSGDGSRVIGKPHYYGPSSWDWPGGAYLDIDEIRYFVPK